MALMIIIINIHMVAIVTHDREVICTLVEHRSQLSSSSSGKITDFLNFQIPRQRIVLCFRWRNKISTQFKIRWEQIFIEWSCSKPILIAVHLPSNPRNNGILRGQDYNWYTSSRTQRVFRLWTGLYSDILG